MSKLSQREDLKDISDIELEVAGFFILLIMKKY